MAGSRTEKIGTILTRVRGLLKSGALNEVDKPVWYDVMEAFPPKTEAKYDRLVSTLPPRQILYREDVIRAKFYEKYGNKEYIDMTNPNLKSFSQRFIEKYNDLGKAGDLDETTLFNKTAEALGLDKHIGTATVKQKDVDARK